MLVKTKYFGENDLAEEKILTFENGIMGFEDYKKYAILFDSEKGENKGAISWLQSLDEEMLAIPIIDPLVIKEDYNPIVEEELLKPLGQLTEENMAMLVTMTIPADLEEMTVNLRAPLIINLDTKKGCQVIVENKDYEIKYKIYDLLKQQMKGDE